MPNLGGFPVLSPQLTMKGSVCRIGREDLKIFWVIIGFVPINMMHNFFRFEISTQHFFNYMTMLIDVAVGVCIRMIGLVDTAIPIKHSRATLPRWMIIAFTRSMYFEALFQCFPRRLNAFRLVIFRYFSLRFLAAWFPDLMRYSSFDPLFILFPATHLMASYVAAVFALYIASSIIVSFDDSGSLPATALAIAVWDFFLLWGIIKHVGNSLLVIGHVPGRSCAAGTFSLLNYSANGQGLVVA